MIVFLIKMKTYMVRLIC